MSQLIRGFSQWFIDVALDPKLICALIDQIMEIQMATNANILGAVGDIVDVVFYFDDLAIQYRFIVKPEIYTRLFEPRLRKYVEFLRSQTSAKIIHHTDGAIVPILGSLADVVGVDGVNPLQVSAVGMDALVDIKQQFGDRLAFWGGVDTQNTMLYGTPADVRDETLSRIRDLNQNGGYVLGAVHNIQVDVPAENVLALFGAALGVDFGLDLSEQEVVPQTVSFPVNGKQGEEVEREEVAEDKAAPIPVVESADEALESQDDVLDTIYDAILEGDKPETVTAVQAALDAGIDPDYILNDARIPALLEVSHLFEIGDLFVPEMLISALAMKGATELLKPFFVAARAETMGRVVIGTVAGDLHDIGKNLVAIMMEGAGFEIVDLGVDVPVEAFVEAVKEYTPDIVAMSALLTTTTRSMIKTIDALKEAGLRDQVKILVGGAPITEEFCERIGADGYTNDAGGAARRAKEFLRVRT